MDGGGWLDWTLWFAFWTSVCPKSGWNPCVSSGRKFPLLKKMNNGDRWDLRESTNADDVDLTRIKILDLGFELIGRKSR